MDTATLPTRSRAVRRPSPTESFVPCESCGLKFISVEALTEHRNIGGAVSTHPGCLRESTMWSTGWSRSRPGQVWSPPRERKARAERSNEEEIYQCVLCNKRLLHAAAFRVHHVHTHLPIGRCLDSDELRALDFEQSAGGLWRSSLGPQALLSWVNRLATIRQEMEAFLSLEHYPTG